LANAEGSLSASAITGEQLSAPYGTTRYTVGSLGTAKAFTGQEADALTGLSYYHARWYDPVVGVFLSVDTKEGNAQGVNPYGYVRENPETATDPTGERVAGCIPGRQGCDPDGTTGTYQCSKKCEAPPTASGGDGGGGGKMDPMPKPPTNGGSSSCDAPCQKNTKSESQQIAQEFRNAAHRLQGAIAEWEACQDIHCWIQVLGTIVGIFAAIGAAIGSGAGGIGALPGTLLGVFAGIVAFAGFEVFRGYVEDILTAEQDLLNSDAAVFENEDYATLTGDSLESERASLEQAGQDFLASHVDNTWLSSIDPIFAPGAHSLVDTIDGKIDYSINAQEREVHQSGIRAVCGPNENILACFAATYGY
jgi:RHS repeat-associated protein